VHPQREAGRSCRSAQEDYLVENAEAFTAVLLDLERQERADEPASGTETETADERPADPRLGRSGGRRPREARNGCVRIMGGE
jgi:hypothetical protein